MMYSVHRSAGLAAMKDETSKTSFSASETSVASGNHLSAPWRHFLRFCEELQHGEIEKLKIQNGLPVLAEVTKKKIKFTL